MEIDLRKRLSEEEKRRRELQISLEDLQQASLSDTKRSNETISCLQEKINTLEVGNLQLRAELIRKLKECKEESISNEEELWASFQEQLSEVKIKLTNTEIQQANESQAKEKLSIELLQADERFTKSTEQASVLEQRCEQNLAQISELMQKLDSLTKGEEQFKDRISSLEATITRLESEGSSQLTVSSMKDLVRFSEILSFRNGHSRKEAHD